MQKLLSIILMALVATMFFSSTVSAGDFKYVGVKKCQTCHKKEKIGDQYGIWLKGAHAKALESLKSEKALKYAKENGIADPAKDPKCLECHSTMAMAKKEDIDPKGKLTMEEGVSCESCHGPGSKYKSGKIMKKKLYDKDFDAAHKAALAAGLLVPDEKVCLTCHNDKNPFHKEFKFAERVKKISHPIPYRKK